MGPEEGLSVKRVILSGGEEDVFSIGFLRSIGDSVGTVVPLWCDVVHFPLSIKHDWLSVVVLNVSEVVVLFGILVVGVWMSVLDIRAMVRVGVVLEPVESLKLVPDGSVFDCLDLGLLSESWLICNW